MSLRVMIVDDSSVMRKLVHRNLRQSGVPVGDIIEAENGKDALDQYDPFEVDLMLVDWNMPEMDGIELIESIRQTEQGPRTGIIMISSEGEGSRMDLAREKGADGFIVKPITPEMMKESIKDVLESEEDHE